MGDGRTYEYVVALRAVQTTDFMTAHWAQLPHELLGRVSSRIINEVRGINRVDLRHLEQAARHDRVGVARHANATFRSGAIWEPIVGYSRAVRVGDARVRRRAPRPPTRTARSSALGDRLRADAADRSPTSPRRWRAPARRSTDVVRTRIFVTDIAPVGSGRPRAWRGVRAPSGRRARWSRWRADRAGDPGRDRGVDRAGHRRAGSADRSACDATTPWMADGARARARPAAARAARCRSARSSCATARSSAAAATRRSPAAIPPRTPRSPRCARRRAALGNYRLPDCALYVTLEPCAMCAGAILHARHRARSSSARAIRRPAPAAR